MIEPGPITNALVSSVHLLGVVLAFSSVLWRGRALDRLPEQPGALATVLRADNAWGISALVLISTGLLRLLVLDKGWAFYSANPFFFSKMTFFGLVFALEVWPMVTLVRLRLRQRTDTPVVAADNARSFARISYVQAAALVGILASASLMARGVGQLAG
jgi:putative membrane protein